MDLSKNGYFNSITKNKATKPAPKVLSAASVLAELTGEPSYDEPEVDVEKDESSNDSDQRIYRTGKSKAKLESSDEHEDEDEEVVVRKDKYDLMKKSSSQKLADEVKQISIASAPPQLLKHETDGPGVKGESFDSERAQPGCLTHPTSEQIASCGSFFQTAIASTLPLTETRISR